MIAEPISGISVGSVDHVQDHWLVSGATCPNSSGSIGLVRARQLLGAEATDLSDEEVVLICRHAETLAHVIVSVFMQNEAGSAD